MEVRKERVNGKGRNYAGGETWSKHAQQDFGKRTTEQMWEVRERKEVSKKKMLERKEVHGKKG